MSEEQVAYNVRPSSTEKSVCQECGMIVQPTEFHPFEFCILWKNGSDPRELYKKIENIALLSSEQAWRENGKKLAEFAHQIIQIAFEGGSLDGGDIQDMGVKYGLLKETTYDPETHGEYDNAELGDDFYEYADFLTSLSQEV